MLYQLEKKLGLRVMMTPIDECIGRERCESGSCSTVLLTSSEPLLINTNGTSIVGLRAYTKMHCACAARQFYESDIIECRPDSCLNGGTCHQLTPSTVQLVLVWFTFHAFLVFFLLELLLCGIRYWLACYSVTLFKHLNSTWNYTCTGGDTNVPTSSFPPFYVKLH